MVVTGNTHPQINVDTFVYCFVVDWEYVFICVYFTFTDICQIKFLLFL